MQEKRYDIFVIHDNNHYQMDDGVDGFFSEAESQELLDKLMNCTNLKFRAKDGSLVCFPNLTGVTIVAIPQK